MFARGQIRVGAVGAEQCLRECFRELGERLQAAGIQLSESPEQCAADELESLADELANAARQWCQLRCAPEGSA